MTFGHRDMAHPSALRKSFFSCCGFFRPAEHLRPREGRDHSSLFTKKADMFIGIVAANTPCFSYGDTAAFSLQTKHLY